MSRSQFPARYVVYDTETREEPDPEDKRSVNLVFRLGSSIVVDPEHHGDSDPHPFQFTNEDEFFDMLRSLPFTPEPIYVFAHNHGFDARIAGWFRRIVSGEYLVLPEAGMPNAGRFKTPLMVLESPPFIVRLWRHDGQVFFLLDTYQWTRLSLQAIGEALQFPKLPMPSPDAPDAEWLTYCHRDVEVTWALLQRLWSFLAYLKVPKFQATPASQTRLLYRAKFEKKRIQVPEDKRCMALDRHAYYGGRVEAFRLGFIDGPVHQVDVSSLYPHMMRSNLFPCAVDVCEHIPQRTKPWDGFPAARATAEVFIETDRVAYPVRHLDGTYWCVGKVRTILCGPELLAALESGHVQFIGRTTLYHMDDLFTGYVHWLWRERLRHRREGNKLEDHWCKSLMNALHGKFGQRDGDWLYRGKQFPADHFGTGKAIGTQRHGDVDVRILAGHTYYRVTEAEDDGSFVPVAAWTASYGRAWMDRVRRTVLGADCYYQATDSLLIGDDSLGRLKAAGLVAEGELGQFRHEGSFQCVTINGIHNLDLDATQKRPGIRRGSKQVAPEVWEQDEWEQTAAGIFRGKVSSVGIRKSLKRTLAGYPRGVVGDDGRVRPHQIDNWRVIPEDQRRLPLAVLD